MKRALMSLIGAVLALAGCAAAPLQPPAEEHFVYPEEPPQEKNGAIYRAGYSAALFEDLRARRLGDIVTIVLTERTDASKKASTTTTKDNAIDVANPTLLGVAPNFRLPGGGPASNAKLNFESKLDSSKSFSGEGESEQSNKLTGSITATVVEILPNGNLRIQGRKMISINQGDEYVHITGTVRPVDIRSDNSVPSTLVADAKIAYSGSGVVADSGEMGWLSRFFNSKWWPF